MRTIRYGIALSAIGAAVLLTGCSGGLDGPTSQESVAGAPAPAQQPASPADEDSAREPQSQGGGGSGVAQVKVTRQDRQIIYTGTMTVRAKEVGPAVAQAKQIVTAAGGHLSKEETSSAGDTEDSATLEFKIPPAQYSGVLGKLGKDLGRQLSMTQNTQDVTLKVADVESRLKSAQESLESLRTLLTKADTIGQVLQVEREISTREADLESLQAQQKELATQVAMATLTLRLVGPVAAVQDPAEEPAGFFGGLEAGWEALVSFTKVTLTVIGAMLPWLAVIVPVFALFLYLLRRARRPADTPATPPPPGPGPEAA